MNTAVHVCFLIRVFAFPRYVLRSGIAGLWGNSIVFKETSLPFSTASAPISIPTNRVGRLPFLHALFGLRLTKNWVFSALSGTLGLNDLPKGATQRASGGF